MLVAAMTFPGEEEAILRSSSVALSKTSSLFDMNPLSASSTFAITRSKIAAWFARHFVARELSVLNTY
jgi:hypothetical protein